METPKEWPREISESFDPIRVLGTGGFASVVLARPKSSQEAASNAVGCIPKKVAIKVVGGNSESSGNVDAAFKYARREIELLKQIRHCGIAQLFYSWEHNNGDCDDEKDCKQLQQGSSPTGGVLVLEYVKGPTVEALLKHGGALSTTFGRVVIAQVMDAVSYLHYRAVLHRDIKPDNIIVTGALSSDASIWDNENSEDVFSRDDKSPEEWKRLCYKYKAKVIDFGFARALTPGDIENVPIHPYKRGSIHPYKKDAGYHNVQNDAQKKNGNAFGKIFRNSSKDISQLDSSAHSVRSVGSIGSVSHQMKRVMSTLGNRNYAAPEIVNKVRQFSAQDKKKDRKQRRASETTQTISSFVADYGLLVDSYSMGHTIRYMMTGVQPGMSVEEAIKKQQRSGMAKKVLSKFGLGKKKRDKEDSQEAKKNLPRKPRYRSLNDLPGQVILLMEELTQICPTQRISIRKARRKIQWISDVLSFQTQNPEDTPSSDESTEGASSLLSLDHFSEEQLRSLDETRYLPIATSTPESVVSTRGFTAPTVATAESNHDFPLEGSDGNSNGSNSSNDSPIFVKDHNDEIGLCLEDDIPTF